MTATITRRQEILDAVRNYLRVKQHWMDDPDTPHYPTQAFETAIESMAEIARAGDVPQDTVRIYNAILDLDREWGLYATGQQRNRDETPKKRFWEAERILVASMQAAETFTIKRPEPVKTLLEQKVGYTQIAMHIYGHNGQGPFLNPDGSINVRLIEQEAENPGSVVPADWIPPQERERARNHAAANQDRLHALTEQHALDSPEHDDEAIGVILECAAAVDVLVSSEMILAYAERNGVGLLTLENQATNGGPMFDGLLEFAVMNIEHARQKEAEETPDRQGNGGFATSEGQPVTDSELRSELDGSNLATNERQSQRSPADAKREPGGSSGAEEDAGESFKPASSPSSGSFTENELREAIAKNISEHGDRPPSEIRESLKPTHGDIHINMINAVRRKLKQEADDNANDQSPGDRSDHPAGD